MTEQRSITSQFLHGADLPEERRSGASRGRHRPGRVGPKGLHSRELIRRVRAGRPTGTGTVESSAAVTTEED